MAIYLSANHYYRRYILSPDLTGVCIHQIIAKQLHLWISHFRSLHCSNFQQSQYEHAMWLHNLGGQSQILKWNTRTPFWRGPAAHLVEHSHSTCMDCAVACVRIASRSETFRVGQIVYFCQESDNPTAVSIATCIPKIEYCRRATVVLVERFPALDRILQVLTVL